MSRLTLVLALTVWRLRFGSSSVLPYGTCDGCVCVPEPDEPCPNDVLLQAASNASFALVELYTSLQHTNPMSLDCNPYNSSNYCTTMPPQELDNVTNETVCAIRYNFGVAVEPSRKSTPAEECPTLYTLETVPSLEEAEAQGLDVSHYGACGLCSTTQDLAVYMTQPNLREAATICGMRTVFNNLQDGIACFLEVDFSLGCSQIWAYNALFTYQHCGDLCLQSLIEAWPNNQEPPTCELNDCLQCDEENSGPMFQVVAGRTRRNSRLLSNIVRPCRAYQPLDILQANKNPCRKTSGGVKQSSAMPMSLVVVAWFVTMWWW